MTISAADDAAVGALTLGDALRAARGKPPASDAHSIGLSVFLPLQFADMARAQAAGEFGRRMQTPLAIIEMATRTDRAAAAVARSITKGII